MFMFVHILYLLSYWVMCDTCFCLFSISFPIFSNRTLIYCGEPLPCGLGEYLARSGLPESCSSLTTVIKEWRITQARLKRALNRTSAGTIGKKALRRSHT